MRTSRPTKPSSRKSPRRPQQRPGPTGPRFGFRRILFRTDSGGAGWWARTFAVVGAIVGLVVFVVTWRHHPSGRAGIVAIAAAALAALALFLIAIVTCLAVAFGKDLLGLFGRQGKNSPPSTPRRAGWLTGLKTLGLSGGLLWLLLSIASGSDGLPIPELLSRVLGNATPPVDGTPGARGVATPDEEVCPPPPPCPDPISTAKTLPAGGEAFAEDLLGSEVIVETGRVGAVVMTGEYVLVRSTGLGTATTPQTVLPGKRVVLERGDQILPHSANAKVSVWSEGSGSADIMETTRPNE